MVSSPKLSQAAELKWFTDSVTTDYSIILDIRNESIDITGRNVYILDQTGSVLDSSNQKTSVEYIMTGMRLTMTRCAVVTRRNSWWTIS